jgi:Tfp pilus assembly protein PilN
MNARDFLHKVFSFLEVQSLVGGLEISDTALRFVASGSTFATSVRLAPGILSGGRIQDEAAFVAALSELRRQILGKKAGTQARVNAVVVLSSIPIYSQVFALPLLKGDELDKAVDLNLKMAMPGGREQSNAGWQMLSENPSSGKVDILSAFLDKNAAEEVTAALRKMNFTVLAIESRALALARLTRFEAAGFDENVPSLVVAADADGLDVLILRHGNLHFDYFQSWKDLKGDIKEITTDDFNAMVVRGVNQILNFYNAHWKDPIGRIFVAATGMESEVIAAITKNFETPTTPLAPMVSPPITAEWFTAFGAALRGRMPRRDDKEVSLLGINAQEEYRREVADHFLGFWRVLAPVALLMLIAIIGGAILLLGRVRTSLASQAVLRLDPTQSREIDTLKMKVQAFNTEINLIAGINAASHPKSVLLGKILDIALRRNITIGRISIADPGTPITLTGTATSENDIRGFKDELVITQGIQNVNLPFTQIRKDGAIYSFSITFTGIQ